jgi:hypothetical protein
VLVLLPTICRGRELTKPLINLSGVDVAAGCVVDILPCTSGTELAGDNLLPVIFASLADVDVDDESITDAAGVALTHAVGFSILDSCTGTFGTCTGTDTGTGILDKVALLFITPGNRLLPLELRLFASIRCNCEEDEGSTNFDDLVTADADVVADDDDCEFSSFFRTFGEPCLELEFDFD